MKDSLKSPTLLHPVDQPQKILKQSRHSVARWTFCWKTEMQPYSSTICRSFPLQMTIFSSNESKYVWQWPWPYVSTNLKNKQLFTFQCNFIFYRQFSGFLPHHSTTRQTPDTIVKKKRNIFQKYNKGWHNHSAKGVLFFHRMERLLQHESESFSCVVFSPSGAETPPESVSFPQLLSLLRYILVSFEVIKLTEKSLFNTSL